MNPSDRHRLVMGLFNEACDLTASERTAFLDERCANDPALRGEVESLLGYDGAPDEFIEAAESGRGVDMLAADLFSEVDTMEDLPERIGRYEIIREIGRGGMGVVYEARQDNPRRRVALKVIRQGFASNQLRRRFEHEVHVLGLLDHPGIAHIYEAGSATISGSSWPYFAMELIEGQPIDAHAHDRGLSTHETLELVARLCDAVQHAHQMGVIHRDLKPGNVLVKEKLTSTESSGDSTLADTIGQPKVLDFGIARATDADLAVTTLQTNVGQIVGTLTYMSPEQLEGNSGQLDTRCDVYAIGVILYRLLAGRAPLELGGKPMAEAARIVRDQEPARLGSVNPAYRGDVETIVAKAMEKDRSRRYASASELAEDLRRYLRSEPIAAHPPSALYQFKKFARRNRALVGGIGATIAALALGLVAVSIALIEAQSQRDLALAERERVEQVVDFQMDFLSGMDARAFGRELLKDQRDDFMGALEQEALDSDEREAAVASFEAVIGRLNGTSLARRALRGTIIEQALEEVNAGISDDPIIEAELRSAVGTMYQHLGLHAESITQFELALDPLRIGLGEDHPRTMSVMSRSGEMLMQAGRLEEARERLTVTLERRRRVLGADHRDTLHTHIHLANTLRLMGKQPEAKTHLFEVIEFSTQSNGVDHPTTLEASSTLGVTLIDLGETEEALQIFSDVLAIRLKDLGPDHSSTILTRNDVMVALFRLNRMEEVEGIARSVLESSIRVNGDDHPISIRSHNNLGRVILDLGRPGEAEQYFREAYILSVKSLGANNEVREASAGNLADVLLALDRPAEAETFCAELLASRRSADPLRPGAIAQTLEQLGLCLMGQDRPAEAEAAFRECIQYRESLDPDHWLTHRARGYLGTSLAAQGRDAEAGSMLKNSALAIERLQDSIAENMREREVRAARRRAESQAAH